MIGVGVRSATLVPKAIASRTASALGEWTSRRMMR